MVAITGASRGIGRAVAEAASARGASVGLIARSPSDLEKAAAALTGPSSVAAADIADPAQLEAALSAIEAALGPVDILVNNAGIGAFGPYVDAGAELVERLMRVNFFAAAHAVDAVVGGMTERRRGHIVMLGSIAGRLGAPYEAAYSASKFAMTGFSEALAVELAPKGVKVSMVHPGPVDTNFFDARGVPYARRWPRPVTPQRVAAAVIRSVERERFETMVPGWLQFPTVVRALAPRLYRAGASRATTPSEA